MMHICQERSLLTFSCCSSGAVLAAFEGPEDCGCFGCCSTKAEVAINIRIHISQSGNGKSDLHLIAVQVI